MRVGTQFTGALAPGETGQWFTHSWPADWQVAWTFMPITPEPGVPQIEWDVEVERASEATVTYWLTVTNLGGSALDFEGRYAVLN
ncbi:hypothetical protein OG871_03560 [Kitasatospora sp. NBC_00374]|uniref:hypothetical protein n=1 Tax=Kitasatospora sp. NBC_00374 TaxID=2975964 RepID=UPI00324E7C23